MFYEFFNDLFFNRLVIGRSMVMGEGKLVIDWITATKSEQKD